MIKMINGEAKKKKTQVEILAAERVAVDKTKPVKYEAFKRAHAEHIRKESGETGLSQDEWESVSCYDVLRMIAISDEKTKVWVGDIMKKATPYERNSFNVLVAQVDENLQKAARAWRAADALQKKIAKEKAKAENENAMRPEF